MRHYWSSNVLKTN